MISTDEPPVMDDIPDQVNYEGNLVVLDTSTVDPQGIRLDYTARGLPAGLEIDEATGEISGTISLTAVADGGSTYDVTVTATQLSADELSDSASFEWTVNHATISAEDDTTDPNADPKYPCPCAMQPVSAVTDGPLSVSLATGNLQVDPLRYLDQSGTTDPSSAGDDPTGSTADPDADMLGDGEEYSPDEQLETSLPEYNTAGLAHPILRVMVTIPDETPDYIEAQVTFGGEEQPVESYAVTAENRARVPRCCCRWTRRISRRGITSTRCN